jgi:hypothetical protein
MQPMASMFMKIFRNFQLNFPTISDSNYTALCFADSSIISWNRGKGGKNEKKNTIMNEVKIVNMLIFFINDQTQS